MFVYGPEDAVLIGRYRDRQCGATTCSREPDGCGWRKTGLFGKPWGKPAVDVFSLI